MVQCKASIMIVNSMPEGFPAVIGDGWDKVHFTPIIDRSSGLRLSGPTLSKFVIEMGEEGDKGILLDRHGCVCRNSQGSPIKLVIDK